MNRLFLLIFISCFGSVFYAQEFVFPGDANANKIIDQYDLLSIGYAFGETGPARIQVEDAGVFQGVPLFWDQMFPNGIDYINADCDGNGMVDYLDFIPLLNNFNTLLENAEPLDIQAGVSGTDPEMIWNNGVVEIAVNNGAELNIPLSIPLDETLAVNGIAYNLRYTPSHFQSINYSTENNWMRMDDQAMSIKQNQEPGLFQVATTRFTVDPVSGGGEEGVLNLVIIVDMVDLLEEPDDTLLSKIYLEDILMIDGDFNQIPVATDSLCLKLYYDLTSNANHFNKLEAKIFPNPSRGEFRVTSTHDFNCIEMIDFLGQTKQLYKGVSIKDWHCNELNVNKGLYSFRLSGENGSSVLKHLILK